MISKYIFPILLFFPLLLLQTTLIPFISIWGVVPDLILILLVFYTLREGQIYGTVLGFVYGFFFDLITGSLLGSTIISKTVSGFIAGYFTNENKLENYFKNYVFVFIVLLCSAVDSLIFSFFSTADLRVNIFMLFIEQGLLPGIYTSVISVLVVFFYPKRSFN